MTAGIVGLGLIGGSLAKAYHEAGERVLAHDIDRDVLSFAVISGAVDEALTDETMAECDVILLAVRPAAAVEWLKNHAAKIDKHTVVIDCCGTKRKVCAACFPIAEQYGITYLGGHPMAGTQFSGFKYAKANLFVGAPMVLVPPRFDDIELLSHVKDLLSPAGFGSYSVTTAEQHDEMIAFTERNRDKITCINISRHLVKYVEESPDEVVGRIACPTRINCVLYKNYPAQKLTDYVERFLPYRIPIQFRYDYTETTPENLYEEEHDKILQDLKKQFTYKGLDGCRMRNGFHFEYKGLHMTYHKTLPYSTIVETGDDGITYDILYDILIKQNGDIHSDWTGVKMDVPAYEKVTFEPYDLKWLEGGPRK